MRNRPNFSRIPGDMWLRQLPTGLYFGISTTSFAFPPAMVPERGCGVPDQPQPVGKPRAMGRNSGW